MSIEGPGVEALADALVERGIVTQAERVAAMAQEQAQEPTGDANAPADISAAQQATENAADAVAAPNPLDAFEIDPAFTAPEDPNAYRFQISEPLDADPAKNLDLIKNVNALFHAAKVPQPIAQAIYSDVERVSKLSERASDAEFNLASQQCDAQLRQAWGDRYDEMVGHFRRFVNDVAKVQPKIVPMLTDTPASNSAVLIRQLAEHGARLYSSPRRTR